MFPGQVQPHAVWAVAVPADRLRDLLRLRHPALYGEQPSAWESRPPSGREGLVPACGDMALRVTA